MTPTHTAVPIVVVVVVVDIVVVVIIEVIVLIDHVRRVVLRVRPRVGRAVVLADGLASDRSGSALVLHRSPAHRPHGLVIAVPGEVPPPNGSQRIAGIVSVVVVNERVVSLHILAASGGPQETEQQSQ